MLGIPNPTKFVIEPKFINKSRKNYKKRVEITKKTWFNL